MNGTALADRLYGLAGNDVLDWTGLGERLWGGVGNDMITGGPGVDDINGGPGNDTVIGGGGADKITGGPGNDVYVLANPRAGGDIIADFSRTTGDRGRFQLASAGFGHLPGTLRSAEFQVGNVPVAATAAIRFLHDKTEHSLYFDADCSGAMTAVLLSVLQPKAEVGSVYISFVWRG